LRSKWPRRFRWLLTVTLALPLVACGVETSARNQAPAQAEAQQHTDAEPSGSAGAPVYPGYQLTADDLSLLINDLPVPVRDAIAASPEAFLEMVDGALELPWDQTVLVDKETPLPPGYAPDELVDLDTLANRLTLSRSGHRLTPETTDALLAMSDAARDDGITLVVSSTYRSYEYQRDLFARWVDELGEAEATQVSARPGTSQHQLGTAVDFGCICPAFAREPAGLWLVENAADYGFSLSYPDGYTETTGYSYEPWHFRFIGTTATRLEQTFFLGVQQWMLEFLHANRARLEAATP
jgi:zinc D-Ala-D-Ala carboxypeptidase